MKIKASLTAVALAIGSFAFASEPNFSSSLTDLTSPRTIQVLLEKDVTEALLEVRGPYAIHNPADGNKVTSGLLGKRFMIHELLSGLKWGEEFPGIHQFYITPRSSETEIFINGIQYAGAVSIYGINGSINIINEVDIESYVKSILSTQFTYPLDKEVMAALAILTRTDAYYHAMKSSDSFWHVIAEEVGYQGSALVVDTSPLTKAIESTKHLVLVHPQEGRNLPFATSWTENSAGKTAPYQTLFRKETTSPTVGVEAPHAALARQDAKWTYRVSKEELARKLDAHDLKSIDLYVDRTSNKVYAVRLKDGGESYDLDFFTFQNSLGKNHLLSSDFSVTMQGDQVLFSGFGKGHGVGLCLYSANALAQNGDNAVKILSKFFPDTFLYNLNAIPGANQ